MATQPRSSSLSELEQGALLLARSPRALAYEAVSQDVIATRRDLLAAINLCIDVSGLDDKEISLSLGIDPGHFSNIRRGKAGCNFPLTKLDDLMTLCGNEIPLTWQAMKRGKGLHMLETESQRLLREANEREAKLLDENRLLREVIQGRGSG
jgi:predicted XRE-type DNA-binding protein